MEDICFFTVSPRLSFIGYVRILTKFEVLKEMTLDVGLILSVVLISSIGYLFKGSNVLR